MPGFLDTSVIVRYLTDDPPEMAEQATRLVEGGAELCLTETALNETAHVLRTVYGLSREEVVDLLVALLQRNNIAFHSLDKAIVIAALLLCRPSGRVSLGDALIWAAARSFAPSVVYSFDRRFPVTGGFRRMGSSSASRNARDCSGHRKRIRRGVDEPFSWCRSRLLLISGSSPDH